MASRSIAAALRWVPVAGYAALIAWISSRSDVNIPAGISDKLVHTVEFALLGALVWRAVAGRLLPARPEGRAAILAAFICIAYAASDEIHQAFVPGRDASMADAAADALGAAGVVAALYAWSRRASGGGARGGHVAEDPAARGAAREGTPGAGASAGGVRRGSGPLLTLIGKAGCHLCDEAESVIRSVQAEIPFVYEKLDVESDPERLGRYAQEIPVVLVAGRKVFKVRVDAERLRKRVREATADHQGAA